MFASVIRSTTARMAFTAALLGFCLMSVQAASAAPSFQPKTDFATGQNPYSVVSADFNGDNKADLATANLGSNNISVLFGNGSGGFGAKTDYPSQSLNPTTVIAGGDFNGDDMADLATANPSTDGSPGGDEVLVFLNDGLGGFGAPTIYGTGPQPSALISGDFNRDNRIDLVSADEAFNGTVSVLLTRDSGGLGPYTPFDAGVYPNSVISLDFNGDNKRDLATANGDGSVSVLVNDTGDGDLVPYFNSPVAFQTGTSNSSSVTSGDFNGDGKPDLATANNFANGGFINSVSVLLGNGSGGVQSAATTFPTAKGPVAITNADFTGDGKPDLATANYGADTVSVLPGKGGGGFGAKTDFATGQVPYSIATADFNGDGKPDLATANSSSNNVSVLLGKGNSPDPDPDPDPDPKPVAKIGSVKVKGPAKLKKGKKGTYTVKVTNSGDTTATGVKLKVGGKGIKLTKKIGSVAAGKTKPVKVKLKPKKPGKIKASFKVTSKNAGSKTVKKKIKVRK